MTAKPPASSEARDFARTRTSLELWFGMLGGPASGFCMVLVGYPLVDRACVTDTPIWLHVSAIFFLATTLLAAYSSWSLHEQIGHWSERERGLLPRARFMTTVGMLTSGISILEILFQWIPVFFIGACHGT